MKLNVRAHFLYLITCVCGVERVRVYEGKREEERTRMWQRENGIMRESVSEKMRGFWVWD